MTRKDREYKSKPLKRPERISDIRRELALYGKRIPLGYIVWDNEFRVMEWNPAAERIFGWSAAEAKGKHAYELIVPQNVQKDVDRIWKGLQEDEGSNRSVNENVAKDGRQLVCEWHNTPLHDDSGNLIGVLSMVHDVTEPKRLEAELHESKLFLQTIIETEPECVKLLASDGALLMMNRAGLDMIEADSLDQVKGKQLFALVSPEYRDAFKALSDGVFQGKPGNLEFAVVGMKGRRRWLDTHAVPLRNDKNEIIALLGITRDITEQKQAQEAILEQKGFAESLLQNSAVATFVLNPQHTVVLWNKACEVLTGIPSSAMIGTDKHWSAFYGQKRPTLADIIIDGDIERIPSLYDRFARSTLIPSGLQAEGWYPDLNGKERYIIFDAAPVYDSKGALAVVIETLHDVTERKRAEEALERERDFISAVLDTAGSMVLVLDRSGKIIRFNSACEQVSGYTFKEVAGKFVWDFLLTPEEVEPVKNVFRNLTAGHFPSKFENYWVAKNGHRRLIAWSNTALLGRDGSVEYVIPTGTDITERKQSEEALLENEQKYRALFDSSAEGFFLMTDTVVDCNEQACRLFGCSRQDIIGRSPFDFSPPVQPDGRQSADAARERIAAAFSGTPQFFSWQHRRADGALIDAEVSLKALTIQGGRALQAIIRDMTERKQKERFINDILESVGEALLVIGRDYRIISANRAFRDQSGLPLEAILGKYCYEVSPAIGKPCYESSALCPAKDTFLTGNPHTMVHSYQDGAGNQVQLEMRSFPMKDASGNVTSVIEIINDVTEKRKLEEQLRHAQRLEAVGRLAGGISHDFNNILTAVIGYGNLLLMKMPNDDPLKHNVEQILASANRAAQLTKSLLAYSRKQIMNPQPVNLNDIVRKTERLLARLISEDIELKMILTDKPVTVLADAGQIEQVLMNLATNARDAMPHGGFVLVETGTVMLDDEFLKARHGHGKPGPYVLLSVTDSGVGMDEQTREKIFEPFFTTKEVGKGTGLGLSMVYGIIQQHDGAIDVYSEIDRGTSFKIYLPAVQADVKELQSTELPALKGGTETILIAEDDGTIRKLMGDILENFGYTVILAEDGVDAVNKFMENRDKIHLLLLDVIMPRKNGKEVFEKIKIFKPAIKTLFVSGYTADFMSQKGILGKGFEVLLKPVSVDELVRRVREVLDAEHKQE